jgi:protein subunit release factor A
VWKNRFYVWPPKVVKARKTFPMYTSLLKLDIPLGAGGGEASIFAQQIFDMYLRYADYLGFGIEKIETEIPPGVSVGIQVRVSVHIMIQDEFSKRLSKYER